VDSPHAVTRHAGIVSLFYPSFRYAGHLQDVLAVSYFNSNEKFHLIGSLTSGKTFLQIEGLMGKYITTVTESH
jgi:hypothetical protein